MTPLYRSGGASARRRALPRRRPARAGLLWLLGLVIAVALPAAPGTAAVPGDVDRDGRVASADLLLVLRHLREAVSPLDADGLVAADLAPAVGGVSVPDGVVDAADLAILLQLLAGELRPAAPTLDMTVTGDNPVVVTGSAPANATVYLFVNGVERDDVTLMEGATAFTFQDVVLLDTDGDPVTLENPIFAVAVVGGLPSPKSNILYQEYDDSGVVHDYPAGHTVIGPEVWTPGIPGVPFTLGNDLVIAPGGKLFITQGTELQFASGAAWTVNGELGVQGVAGEEVVFHAPGVTWLGIDVELDSANLTASIDGAIIRDAEIGVSSADFSSVANTNLEVLNTLIELPNFSAIGVELLDDNLVSRVWRTTIDCLTTEGTGAVLEPGLSIPRTIELAESEIIGRCAKGVDLIGQVLVRDSRIDRSGSSPVGSLGLKIRQGGFFPNVPAIVGNELRGFGTGIQVLSILGGTPLWPQPFIRWNTFSGNTTNLQIGSGDGFQAPQTVIDAQYNDWGVYTPIGTPGTDIDETIQDFEDNDQSARVDYVPFLDMNGEPVLTYALGRIYPEDLDPAGPPVQQIGPIIFPLYNPSDENGVGLGAGQIPSGVTIPMIPAFGAIEGYGKLKIGQTTGDPLILLCPAPCDPTGHWPGIVVQAANSDIRNTHILDATRAIDILGPDFLPFASATNMKVTDTEVRNFSEVGISFSGGATGTVDDTLVGNEGELTEGTGVGIEIVDSDVDIHGTTARDSRAGVHVMGASNGTLGTYDAGAFPDNTITGNSWGVWLEQTAGGMPNVTINGNSIAGNTRATDPLVDPPPANLRITGLAGLTIDAQNNYWGFETAGDAEAVQATIQQDPQEDPVIVDFSAFVDAGGTVVGPSPAYTTVFRDVSTSLKVITPTLGSAMTTDIAFTTLVAGSVEVRIFDELEPDPANATPLKTIPVANPSAGPRTVPWNGTDDTGKILPPEAYIFVLVHGDGTGPGAFYSPERDTTEYPQGSGAAQLDPMDPADLAFNPFENDFLKVNWRILGGPSRGFFRVPPENFVVPPNGIPVHAPDATTEVPLLYVWDGRRQDGSLVSVFTSAEFDVPAKLRPNYVIVEKTLPDVTGPGLDLDPNFDIEPEVLPDPFRVTHSYDQVLSFGYCVDQTALVTIKLIRPDDTEVELSPQASRTDCTTFPSPTSLWDGRDANGKLVVLEDGVHTLQIEAQNPDGNQSHLRTTYRGVLQLRQ